MAGAVEALTSTAEVADTNANKNDTTGTAQNASTNVPFRLNTASLSSGTDVDYVKFQAPAGSTGKHLHVTTTSGTDVNTDTEVTLFTGTGTTAFDGGVHDDDVGCFFGCANYGEDFQTTATLTEGNNYWIKVDAGQTYSTSDTDYVLIFWIE
jgi:hypothetical protein